VSNRRIAYGLGRPSIAYGVGRPLPWPRGWPEAYNARRQRAMVHPLAARVLAFADRRMWDEREDAIRVLVTRGRGPQFRAQLLRLPEHVRQLLAEALHPPKAAAPGAPTSAASAPSAQPSPAPTTAPNAPPAEPPAQGPPTQTHEMNLAGGTMRHPIRQASGGVSCYAC
jgi:hypothetical protein